MRRVIAAVAVWAVLPPAAVFAQQTKEEALLARIEALEKRVAQLEKAAKAVEAPGKKAEGTEVETKLIGTWTVVDADRKDALLHDLRFTKDRCSGSIKTSEGMELFTHDYYLVGRQITVKVTTKVGLVNVERRVVSVSDTELVLEVADKTVKYTREK